MKKENYLYLLWVISIIVWLLIMSFAPNNIQAWGSSIINFWSIMIFIWFIQAKKRSKNELLKDERTEKVACKSIWLSWFITFIVINIFFWIDRYTNIILTNNQIFSLLFFIMIFSVIIWKVYYNKKPI